MTNISDRNIDTEHFKRIEEEFALCISKQSKKSASNVLKELLTESEYIMLVKRYGALFLLEHGYSPYRVAVTLGLSEPTVHRLHEEHELGAYSHLFSHLSRNEQSEFLSVFLDILRAKGDMKARRRLTKHALGK